MGYHIWNEDEMLDGNHLNKADRLLAAYPEIREVTFCAARFDRNGETVLVCVVQNRRFDAAAVAYNENEMLDYAVPDGRQKRWLQLPRALVLKLCPAVKDLLPRPKDVLVPQNTRKG